MLCTHLSQHKMKSMTMSGDITKLEVEHSFVIAIGSWSQYHSVNISCMATAIELYTVGVVT